MKNGKKEPSMGWTKATSKNLNLDQPTSHGGWPGGEYEPPINKVIKDYLRSMMLISESPSVAIRQPELQDKQASFVSHLREPSMGDVVSNGNPGCKHYRSMGFVAGIQPMEGGEGKLVSYCCMNSGEHWKVGDVLTKTMDQIFPFGEER
jgi:hypothetical protein